MYIPRQAEETIKTLSQGFPIVAVTGPRQSGKSTLAARIFQDRPYVSLEDPDEDEFAANDPRGFLAWYFGRAAVCRTLPSCPRPAGIPRFVVSQLYSHLHWARCPPNAECQWLIHISDILVFVCRQGRAAAQSIIFSQRLRHISQYCQSLAFCSGSKLYCLSFKTALQKLQ